MFLYQWPNEPDGRVVAASQPVEEEGDWLPDEALRQEATPASTDQFVRPSIPEPTGPVSASQLSAGTYTCKLSKEYKLRPCSITLDRHGRSILEVPEGLLAVRGILTDAGKSVSFEGITTEERPFGCFACQERCSIDPASCVCKEHPKEASQLCLSQPIRFTLKRQSSGRWAGRLRYDVYYNDHAAPSGFRAETLDLVVVVAPDRQ